MLFESEVIECTLFLGTHAEDVRSFGQSLEDVKDPFRQRASQIIEVLPLV